MDGSDKTNTTLSCPNELALILIYRCVRSSPPVDNKKKYPKLWRIQKKQMPKKAKCRPNFVNNVIKIGRWSEPLMTYHTCIKAKGSLSGRNCWFYTKSIGFHFSEAISGGDRFGSVRHAKKKAKTKTSKRDKQKAINIRNISIRFWAGGSNHI